MDIAELNDEAFENARQPPHSMEAEQSVLGGLMLDNDAWDTVSEVLLEQHFFSGNNRSIFRTMQKLIDAGRPIDVVTLSEELDRTGELESAGGLEYLVSLARNTPSASNIRAYSEIVRDRALLRQMLKVAGEIADSAYNPEGRASDEILNEAEQKIFQIAENRPNQGGPEPINPLLKRALDRIETLFNNADALTGVTTGFDDLDARTRWTAEVGPDHRGRPSLHGENHLRHEPGGERPDGYGKADPGVQSGDARGSAHIAHALLSGAHRPDPCAQWAVAGRGVAEADQRHQHAQEQAPVYR